jgi:TonB-dependent SusC/RagA subfamily outer membrane receptor
VRDDSSAFFYPDESEMRIIYRRQRTPQLEVRMSSISPRTPRRAWGAALLVFALTAFLDACAHRSRPGEPSAEPAAKNAGTVTADAVEKDGATSIEQMLAGRVAGVTVTRAADGSIAVRIRGTSPTYTSQEPLYIVDGVPLVPGPGGALSGISAHDIESIQVLKNAADVSMYGSRGANGVIVITTKRAKPH